MHYSTLSPPAAPKPIGQQAAKATNNGIPCPFLCTSMGIPAASLPAPPNPPICLRPIPMLSLSCGDTLRSRPRVAPCDVWQHNTHPTNGTEIVLLALAETGGLAKRTICTKLAQDATPPGLPHPRKNHGPTNRTFCTKSTPDRRPRQPIFRPPDSPARRGRANITNCTKPAHKKRPAAATLESRSCTACTSCTKRTRPLPGLPDLRPSPRAPCRS